MKKFSLASCLMGSLITSGIALADPARDAIVAALAVEAKAANPAFTAFSAKDGEAFWMATQTGGKADTSSCTACHGKDAKATGQTRAGKAIDPMAVSVNPARYTDAEKVAKWFGRNCNTVLGRECTATEKGNVITYLSSL